MLFVFFLSHSNRVFSQPIDYEHINEDEYFARVRGHNIVFLQRKDSTIYRGEGNLIHVYSPKISGIKRKIQNGRIVTYKDDFAYMINGISVSKDTYDKIVELMNENEIETYIELVYSDTCTLGCIAKLCFDTELKISILVNKQEYRSNPLFSNYGETLLKDEQILSIKREKRFSKKDHIEVLLK
jgi:hypothetical protein